MNDDTPPEGTPVQKGILRRAAEASQTQLEQRRESREQREQQAAVRAQQAATERAAWVQQALAAGHSGIEYRVETVRETLVGDKINHAALAQLLNQRAMEGWTLKQMVGASVEGRVGPGGVGGMLLVFERPLR